MDETELRELNDSDLFELLDCLGCVVDLGNGQAAVEIDLTEHQVAEAVEEDESIGVDEVW